MAANETPFDMACRVAGVSSDGDRTLFEMIWKAAKLKVVNQWGVPDMTGSFDFDFLVARVAAFDMDARGATGAEANIPQQLLSEGYAMRNTYSVEVDA